MVPVNNVLALRFADPEERQKLLETVKNAAEANKRIFSRLQGTERFRSPCFEFVRRLRWEPALRGLTAEEAGDVVDAALREIYPEGAELAWERLLGHNDTDGHQVDPFSDFLLCWESVKEAASALKTALDEVRADPEGAEAFLGDRLRGPAWRRFREFLAFCNRLHENGGERMIWPAVEPVGQAFNVKPQQVSRWRKLAVSYGYLELVVESHPGHAAEYRFHPEPRNEGAAPRR